MTTTFTRIMITTIIFSLVGFAISVDQKAFWTPDKDGVIDVTPVKNVSEKDTLNDTLAREFLSAHNKARKERGEPDLLWDNVIADYARNWGKERAKDCQMIHSYGPYGENLFWGKYATYTAADSVQAWLDEKKDYNEKTLECTVGKMCGHYTQVMWRDSLNLGCAMQKCNNGSQLIVCSYNPPGNYQNQSPFVSRKYVRRHKYNLKTRSQHGAPLPSPSSSKTSTPSSPKTIK